MTEFYNVAAGLAEIATRAPYRPGIIFPAGRDTRGRAKYIQFTFQQLNEEVDRYAQGFSTFGICQGERVLLMVKPGPELISIVFALVKMGAVPVLIDPGMGRRAFLQCVVETEPAALIGIPLAHILRSVLPKSFATVERSVMVGHVPFLADVTLSALRTASPAPFPVVPTTTEDEAGVAFTSGSTGIPKGVVYTHGIFRALVTLLRDEIGIREGEVDLALLYIFALFNPALGVTTVIPDMDPTQSAKVNPAYVVEAIRTHGVTNAFGSPTIWKRVAPYCLEHGFALPSLKRVLMAGAPVPPDLVHTLLTRILHEHAEINTPFGATEAMPLTYMNGREIVAETAALSTEGQGMCVGRPLPGITVRVIRIVDEAIPTWDPSLVLPQGEIGEIVANGPVVTHTYLNRPEQTRLAKIKHSDGSVWHRMGDTGYFDEKGRLWFCGRKSHRVITAEGTWFPVLCETIFNRHPKVARTALVGVGKPGGQSPVLVVEPKPGDFPYAILDQQKFTLELMALGAEYAHTRAIQQVLFYPGTFPTDVRHNAKIQREKLADWAAKRLPEKLAAQSPQTVQAVASERKSLLASARQLMALIGLVVGIVLSVLLLGRHFREDKRKGE